MVVDPKRSRPEPIVLTAERQFEGSVFDVADARRFARVTAEWWGVETAAVEEVVEELARSAVCREQPAFRLYLSLEGSDVKVQTDEMAADAPVREGPARLRSVAEPGRARRS